MTEPEAATGEGAGAVLTSASKLIAEAAGLAGADVFVYYSITPANLIHQFSATSMPAILAAQDEITAIQMMAGFSATGKFPVTATSFPGLALMVESINMAFMMELPMLIILVQRLGPSTGSATTNAQGDLLMLRGLVSGGFQVPVYCPSSPQECAVLTRTAMDTSIRLRTPVVLLTSKEMVMTQFSLPPESIPRISPVERTGMDGVPECLPYDAGECLVPPFVPLGNDERLTRLNASSHGKDGITGKASNEVIANTRRLKWKVDRGLEGSSLMELEEPSREGSDPTGNVLLVTYGITSGAVRRARNVLLEDHGTNVSICTIKSLLPIPTELCTLVERYDRVLFVEENLTGQLMELVVGARGRPGIRHLGAIGEMVLPGDIVKEVVSWDS